MEINYSGWIALQPPLAAFIGDHEVQVKEISPDGFRLASYNHARPFIAGDTGDFSVAVHGSQEKYLFHIEKQPVSVQGGMFQCQILQEQAPVLARLLGQIRKNQHIDLCVASDVEASDKDNGLSQVHLQPSSMPELNWEDIDTRSCFLRTIFPWPILITGMTGGIEKGSKINQRLAALASKFQIPMGVGSQRIALESPQYASIFRLKDRYPALFLIGNIGAAQLVDEEDPVLWCQRAVDMIKADALAIHINVLQECLQPEGNRHFKGLSERIRVVCSELKVPVIVKEVGAGLDARTARQLAEDGVAALDTGGKGGTSWGYIEGLRNTCPQTLRLATLFRDWGLTTRESLEGAGPVARRKGLDLVATGGIRHGLDVAKSCALGAAMAGVGLPFLRAALRSDQELEDEFLFFCNGLRVAMMVTGSQRLSELSSSLLMGSAHA